MDVHWRVIHVFLILMPTKIKLVPKVNEGESDAYVTLRVTRKLLNITHIYTEAYQTVLLVLK